jgi:hypothetical protein
VDLIRIVLEVALALILLRIAYRVAKVLVARAAVRAALADVGERALAKQPEAIRLEPAPGLVWKDEVAARFMMERLLALGFDDAGTFTIPELKHIRVRLFARPADRIGAGVYEHPKAGIWCELFSRYEDGGSATFTTTPARGLARRPGHVVVHAPGTSPDALLARALAERRPEGLIVIPAAELPRVFEAAYASAAAWRKKQGISAEEVAKVAITRDPAPKKEEQRS